MTSNTWFATIFVFANLLQTINGEFDGNITCDDRIYEHWEREGPSKTYLFSIDGTNNVTFDSCDGSGSQTVTVWDSSGNLISNGSCPFGHDCGECVGKDEEAVHFYEHFTIPNMVAGNYSIKIHVAGSDINSVTIALNINCVPLTLTCPAGSNQIGELNEDIVGCGLQSCDNETRFELSTIEACQERCNEHENCVSFSWAPNARTQNPTQTPTIYPTVSPSKSPSKTPSKSPSKTPSTTPSTTPTTQPTTQPTNEPTTEKPTTAPTPYDGPPLRRRAIESEGDDSVDGQNICTLYNITVSNGETDYDQVLCKDISSIKCGNDDLIIEFAISGIIQVVMALIAVWLVAGYLVRFRIVCEDEKIMVFSVLGCLLLAFMHGCVRSFILTNVIVPDSDTILRLRCNGLFWHQIFVLHIGQLLVYTYLLSKLHSLESLNVFTTTMYYCLLLFVSVIILFTTAVLPWYSIPEIDPGSCDSDLVMCIIATPSGIYDEYAIFLGVNLLVPFVLLFVFLYQFYQLCTESGCCTMGRNTFTYQILYLGTLLICVQFAEFIYFLIEEETFHAVLFTVYSIVILCSFKICQVNEETGDSLWCCWCCIKDNKYRKVNTQTQQEQESVDQVEDDVIGPLGGPINRVHAPVHVIKKEESIGLI